MQQATTLRPRELEVASWIAEGKTNKEIADELDISDQTVKNHITSILRQLKMSTRSQVAVWYALGARTGGGDE